MNPSAMSMSRARITGLVLLLYLVSIDLVMIFVDRVPSLYDSAFVSRTSSTSSSRCSSTACSGPSAIGSPSSRRPAASWDAPSASTITSCAAAPISSIPFLALFILLTGILIARSTFCRASSAG